MFGWFNADAARASRLKRSNACGSLARSSGRNLERRSDQGRCPCLVNHTHPAPAQLLDDAIVRDGLPDERVEVSHGSVILGCGQKPSQRTGSDCGSICAPGNHHQCPPNQSISCLCGYGIVSESSGSKRRVRRQRRQTQPLRDLRILGKQPREISPRPRNRAVRERTRMPTDQCPPLHRSSE